MNAPAAAATVWSWSALPTIIAAAAAALGANRALELVITRRTRRGQDTKVQVDAGVLISGELRQWAAQAIAEKAAANRRADELEAKFQLRVDELVRKLDEAGQKLDAAEERIDQLTRRIVSCQAGPVCPVRTADAP